jgi:hypothetical protein
LSPDQAVLKAYKLRTRDGLRLKRMPKRPHPPKPTPLGNRVGELLRRGLSNREVMRRSGASSAYVGRIRARLGLLTLRLWTPEEDALFAQFSVTEVAKRTGRTMQSASDRLRLLRRRGWA